MFLASAWLGKTIFFMETPSHKLRTVGTHRELHFCVACSWLLGIIKKNIRMQIFSCLPIFWNIHIYQNDKLYASFALYPSLWWIRIRGFLSIILPDPDRNFVVFLNKKIKLVDPSLSFTKFYLELEIFG